MRWKQMKNTSTLKILRCHESPAPCWDMYNSIRGGGRTRGAPAGYGAGHVEFHLTETAHGGASLERWGVCQNWPAWDSCWKESQSYFGHCFLTGGTNQCFVWVFGWSGWQLVIVDENHPSWQMPRIARQRLRAAMGVCQNVWTCVWGMSMRLGRRPQESRFELGSSSMQVSHCRGSEVATSRNLVHANMREVRNALRGRLWSSHLLPQIFCWTHRASTFDRR